MLRNGRLLVIAVVYSIIAAIVLGVTFLTMLWSGNDSFAPLGDYNTPQLILSSKTVSVGGYILVKGTKCNLSDKPVSVVGTAYFRQENSETKYVGLFTGTRILEPGCITKIFRNNLPPEVTPGTWILCGYDEVREGSKVQTITWKTESFEVIP